MLCYLFLILTFYIHSAVLSYDAIINLGGDSQVAYQMQIHGIHNKTSLFDNLPCSCDMLTKFLENKFAGWLEKENLIYREVGNEKYIVDVHYGVSWPFAFALKPAAFFEKCTEIKQSYTPLVESFLKVVQESKRPLFIRKGITKADAYILITTLSQLCNHDNFTLVAIDGSDEIKTPWNSSYVKNYFLRQPSPYSWKGDSQAWKEIFIDLGLKINDKNMQSQ